MATTAEIRNRALKMLGVVGRGQTPRTEDSSDMDVAYQELHAELLIKGRTPWGDNATAVPAAYVRPIVALLAYSRISDYNVPDLRAKKIVAAAVTAESLLDELLSVPMQGTTPIEYF